MLKKQTIIIGAATGWGAQKRSTEHGPDAMHYFGILDKLQQENFCVNWDETIYPTQRFANDNDISPSMCLPFVTEMCQNVYDSVISVLKKEQFPCVIGGDHSIAIGTWSALAKREDEIGLIWFDAHMDAHTPQTTPSHAYHGMPVACLLGSGEKSLTTIGSDKPKLKPENVVLIGIRSFEPLEETFLQKLGVKIFYMKDIQKIGFEAALKEAIAIVSKNTSAFGLSLDLDGFDPSVAPGVGSPAEHGLTKEEVLPCLHLLKEHPKFKALEITEYNPHFDIQMKTAHLIHNILREILV